MNRVLIGYIDIDRVKLARVPRDQGLERIRIVIPDRHMRAGGQESFNDFPPDPGTTTCDNSVSSRKVIACESGHLYTQKKGSCIELPSILLSL